MFALIVQTVNTFLPPSPLPHIPDLTVEGFFSSSGGEESRFYRLRQTLAELLQSVPEDVHIFSVGDRSRQREKELNVWFAARGAPYCKPEKLHGYVAAHKAKVMRETGHVLSAH